MTHRAIHSNSSEHSSPIPALKSSSPLNAQLPLTGRASRLPTMERLFSSQRVKIPIPPSIFARTTRHDKDASCHFKSIPRHRYLMRRAFFSFRLLTPPPLIPLRPARCVTSNEAKESTSVFISSRRIQRAEKTAVRGRERENELN